MILPRSMVRVCALILWVVGLTACAGHAPVPGGNDDINSKFYASPADFQHRVNQLHPGMSHGQVFAILGRHAGEMTKLSRAEIMAALYGSQNAQFDGSYHEQENARAFLQTLYGYRMEYAKIDREHGFSSPIRIRTEKHGYRYTLLLIFQNGRLFDQPILSGGVVTDASSKTLFDYINPFSLARDGL